MAISSELVISPSLIYDHYYLGGIDNQGNIEQVWGTDAIKNAIKMWVASYRGENVRYPNRGGYVTQWLFKPMNQTRADDIMTSIRDGIDQDFKPFLSIQALQVTPVYEQRYWQIYLEVFSSDLNVQVTISEKVRNQV